MWVDESIDPTRAAWSLHDKIGRIGAVHAWLRLESPPGQADFPYRLRLRDLRTGQLSTGGRARDGDRFRLLLHAEAADLQDFLVPRYVYVFAIDSHATRTLIFPRRTQGNVENRLPLQRAGTSAYPEQIPVGPAFSISPPLGTDTFVMLSSVEPIARPDVLEGEGVRGGEQAADSPDPMTRLLHWMQGTMRGVRMEVPLSWSIDRVTLRTSPRSH